MSGPKSYCVEIFDKYLKEIFLLQSELKTLWNDLTDKKFVGEKHEIQYDTTAFVKANITEFNQHSDPYIFLGTDDMSQQLFDEYYNQVYETIEELLEFKKKVDTESKRIDTIHASYKHYLELEEYATEVQDIFIALRVQLLQYLTHNIKDDGVREEFSAIISEVEFSIDFPDFSDQFNPIEAAQLRKEYNDALVILRGALSTIMQDILNTAKKAQQSQQKKESQSETLEEYLKSVSDQEFVLFQMKIEKLLPGISNQSTRDGFTKRFQNLMQERGHSDLYFFAEFHEEIKEEIRQEEMLNQIHSIQSKISNIVFDDTLQKNLSQLQKHINKVMLHDRIKQVDVDNIHTEMQHLLDMQGKIELLQQVKAEESKYIKTMIVKGFNDLDYEVMEDMKVIDFENTDSVLMDIPGQKNYLNLRFDNDRLLYNFLIPENKDDLSHEQTQTRLAEMEETCTQFKKVLEDLKSRGLKIDLQKEIAATEKALIQVPPKLQPQVNNTIKKGRSKTAQKRRNYLGK